MAQQKFDVQPLQIYKESLNQQSSFEILEYLNCLMLALILSLLPLALGQSCEYGQFPIQPVNEWPSSMIPLNTSFYAKFINVRGFPVASSTKVPDAALVEAARWICLLFSNTKPDVIENMVKNKGKMTLMAHDPLEGIGDIPEFAALGPVDWSERGRGLGGGITEPTTTLGAENVLCQLNDVYYRGECILIHEMAHTMIDMQGTYYWHDMIEPAYAAAKSKGTFNNTYAMTNMGEYWAEGAQSWFNCNGYSSPANGFHNEIHTRDQLKSADPDLAKVLSEMFGDTSLRYQCPPSQAEIMAAYRKNQGYISSISHSFLTATGDSKPTSTSEVSTKSAGHHLHSLSIQAISLLCCVLSSLI